MKPRAAQQMQRFERTGLLCVDPRAFFELFAVPAARVVESRDNVAVIDISGPLVQRDEYWCDSYEAIRARFREACASDARAIVMRFDSPGGDASGCFETARALRAEADAVGKPLLAYLDKACSAAYALASAAHVIAIGESCCAGSIGVLSSRTDVTAMNAQRGVRMAFVTSGQRKLDGNPDAPITDAELLQTQKHVDDLALKFFALIADQRPQLSAATIAAFDGGVFYGDAAVSVGLADVVTTFDELLALASTGDPMTMLAKSDYEGARGMLEKVAKGNDANAAAARRALAAMAESEPGDDDDKDEPASEGDDDKDAAATSDDAAASSGDDDTDAASGDAGASAADDTDPPADDAKKPKSAAAQASDASAELTLAAKVHRLEAQMAADREAAERRRLMASRPDFGAELKAALAKAPIATVREMVKTLPKGKVAPKKAAITTVGAVRAEGTVPDANGNTPPSARSPEALEMDRRMGLISQEIVCRREGNALVFGMQDVVVTPSGNKPTNQGVA